MWSCRKSANIQLQEGRKEERVLLPLRQDVPNGGNCLVGGMSWENKSHGRSSHASGGVRLSKIFRSLSSDKKFPQSERVNLPFTWNVISHSTLLGLGRKDSIYSILSDNGKLS